MRLKDKVAIVTGGGRGIGKAISLAFASEGAMIRGPSMSLEGGLQLEDDFQRYIMSTKDFEEGITAFREKRKPKFEGK